MKNGTVASSISVAYIIILRAVSASKPCYFSGAAGQIISKQGLGTGKNIKRVGAISMYLHKK